jgi:hypothetical protein
MFGQKESNIRKMPSNYKIPKSKFEFSLQRLLFFIIGIAAVLLQSGCRQAIWEADMNKEDKMIEERTEFFDAVKSVNPALFTEVKNFEDIPSVVYFESTHWDKMMFRESTGPHAEDTKSQHYYYTAQNEADFDLLRHVYLLKDISITVTESRIFMHIMIQNFSPVDYGGDDPLAQAAALSVMLLNVADKPQFEWVGDDLKYKSFTNNPGVEFMDFEKWTDRIDGTTTAEGLILLCYKADSSWDSFVDTSDWFPVEFRNKMRGGAK